LGFRRGGAFLGAGSASEKRRRVTGFESRHSLPREGAHTLRQPPAFRRVLLPAIRRGVTGCVTGFESKNSLPN